MAVAKEATNPLLNDFIYFFPVEVIGTLHLAFSAEQAGLKRKEVKAVSLRLSHLFVHSTDIYLVRTMN